MATILIVDDERLLAQQLARSLEGEGHQVRTVLTGTEAIETTLNNPLDLVLLDLCLPDGSGLEVLRELHSIDPELRVVLMTGHGTVRDAVKAMRDGAADYLQKPLDLDEVGLLVERILTQQRRDRELDYLRGREQRPGIIGSDKRLLEVFTYAERLRDANLPPGKRPTILFRGETGTGKGVLARAVHETLGSGPFIEFNCPAMPATLMEAELFGHERGSFTDARSSRPGLFEAAEGGTLFFDEIGELNPETQAKLLKVIDEKRVRRIGATTERAVDVHVMAATNRDLDAAAAAGEFRLDLLHRLRVLEIEVPPLRERPEDLRLLARYFCSELGIQYHGRPLRLSTEAEHLLGRYAWPGNVRELRNVIERAALVERSEELSARTFSALMDVADEVPAFHFTLPEGGVDLQALERELLSQALERTAGNRTRAAALLGLTRYAFRYRLEKFGLS